MLIPIGSTSGYGDDPDRLFLKFKTHEVKYNFVSRKKKSPLPPSINRFFQLTPVFLFFVLFDKKKILNFMILCLFCLRMANNRCAVSYLNFNPTYHYKYGKPNETVTWYVIDLKGTHTYM